jgi:hypothetical protein
MKKIIIALGILALAGCGTPAAGAQAAGAPAVPVVQAQSQGSVPANPEPLLARTGVTMAGAQGVSADIYGDRYDCAYFGGDAGEEVCAETYRDAAGEQADLQRNASPSDGSVPAVVSSTSIVWVTPVQEADGTFAFSPSAAVIAARVR